MTDSHRKYRLPKGAGNPRPKTMREVHYSLSPAERQKQIDLFADPYLEVRTERVRQQYRDLAAADPEKAEAVAEMLELLDELEDVQKELRDYFFKELPEARPQPGNS